MASSRLPTHEALSRLRDALLDSRGLVRAVAAGRQRGRSVPWRRAELRYVEVKAGLALQLTTYDETRARARNAPASSPEAEELVGEVLDAPFGNWHVETAAETMQLRITKKGEALVHVRPSEQAPAPTEREHDRAKPRMLPADHPVFRAVGIADAQGRVKASRQAKFRQVDEFLRILQPTLDSLPARPLRVVDLGCGNAYLTFAAAAYLLDVLKRPARVVGIDVRSQARRRNAELATSLGMDQHVTFQESTIAEAELEERPDVVLSLHACDTATDEALARAIRWQAPVILAAPCCHHELQSQLSKASTPDPYGMVARHGILRERFADVLTDAVRASLLRQHGYRVDAMQFVGSEHTPRNVMLRAFHTGAEPTDALRREYAELTTAWGIRPALARMLESPTAQGLEG
jgi:hypothetical protein